MPPRNPGPRAGAKGDPRYLALRQSLARHARTLLSDPSQGIRCLAIGRKSAEPFRPGEVVPDLCLTAYVDEKRSRRELTRARVPPFAEAFAKAASFAVPRLPTLELPEFDVVACGSAFVPQPGLRVPMASRKDEDAPPVLDVRRRFQSLRVGLGITHPGDYPEFASVGTIGFFVQDPSTSPPRVFLVSNNHVIGRCNQGEIGDAVVQPGTLDMTRGDVDRLPTLRALVAKNRIARLSAIVPLEFLDPGDPEAGPENHADTAMAELTEARSSDDLDRLAYGGRIRGIARPYRVDARGALVGDPRVHKLGRTTGATEGQIIGLGGTARIPYGEGSDQDADFVDQLVVRATPMNSGPFSNPGDSGSGVLDADHRLVGLLFAGSSHQTLVNPIAAVLRALRRASGLPKLQVLASR